MTKNEAKTVKIGQIIYLKTHLCNILPLTVEDIETEELKNGDLSVNTFWFTDGTYEKVSNEGSSYLFLTEKEALLSCKEELSKKINSINKKIIELDNKK